VSQRTENIIKLTCSGVFFAAIAAQLAYFIRALINHTKGIPNPLLLSRVWMLTLAISGVVAFSIMFILIFLSLKNKKSSAYYTGISILVLISLLFLVGLKFLFSGNEAQFIGKIGEFLLEIRGLMYFFLGLVVFAALSAPIIFARMSILLDEDVKLCNKTKYSLLVFLGLFLLTNLFFAGCIVSSIFYFPDRFFSLDPVNPLLPSTNGWAIFFSVSCFLISIAAIVSTVFLVKEIYEFKQDVKNKVTNTLTPEHQRKKQQKIKEKQEEFNTIKIIVSCLSIATAAILIPTGVFNALYAANPQMALASNFVFYSNIVF
jgi:hypothetical protein